MANLKSLKPFKEGFDPRRNIEGRPPGSHNFKTDFELACREVAKALRLGKEPEQIRIELIKRGVEEGLKGKFPFWKEIMDRYYGKTNEPTLLQTIEFKPPLGGEIPDVGE